MFKKIHWTFSIYFLNSNYLVSLHDQCLFLRLGTVGTQKVALSRLHMSHDTKVTDYTVLHSSRIGVQKWRNVHVATQGRLSNSVI